MEKSFIHPEEDPYQWREKAKSDLRLAMDIVEQLQGSRHYPAHVCFLCQQAVEKFLKAVIVTCSDIPSRTHDVEQLIDIAIPFCSSLSSLKEAVAFLTPFAMEIRYPEPEPFPIEQVEHALRVAKEINAIIEGWFGSRNRS